jgi:hypothetical protein
MKAFYILKNIVHKTNIISHHNDTKAKPRPESMILREVCGKIKQRKIREPINDSKEDSKEK